MKRIVDRELIEFIKKECPCLACGRQPVDAHHVKSQGSGGNDVVENLMPLCREHHSFGIDCVHSLGLNRFVLKFPAAQHWLLTAGWEFDEFRDKWVMPKKEN